MKKYNRNPDIEISTGLLDGIYRTGKKALAIGSVLIPFGCSVSKQTIKPPTNTDKPPIVENYAIGAPSYQEVTIEELDPNTGKVTKRTRIKNDAKPDTAIVDPYWYNSYNPTRIFYYTNPSRNNI